MPTHSFPSVAADLQASPRNWLVTGGAGFIGSNLVQTLLQLGQRVTVLDNFATGYRRWLDEGVAPQHRGRFRLIVGDIRSMDDCLAACDGADYVLHQAAIASVQRSIDDPFHTNDVNVGGTVCVFTAARECAVRRVVYASSSAVYGDAAREVLREEDADRGRMLSPYALTKRVTEDYASLFARLHGMDTVGLRYFNVFGPRQDPRGAYAAVFPIWIEAMLQGRACRIFGDGTTTRDFIHVDGVCRANILAATAPLSEASPRVFNVGSGHATSLNALHGILRGAVARHRSGEQPSRLHEPFRPGDIAHSLADTSRLRCMLGYEAPASFPELVERTVAWYAAPAPQIPLARSA